MNTSDIGIEFIRRQIAGQTPEQLRTWVNNVLTNSEDAEAAGWQIRTAAQALERKEPMQYLIDQLLPFPSLSSVYGGPGSLKSMLFADMGVCVAGGLRWLDQITSDLVQPGITFQTVQAPVLWIDFDNGARRTDIRIGALLRGHGLGEETPMHYVSMPVPHLDASRSEHVAALGRLINHHGYKLIIIDNLGLITGDTEENNADMANVMGNLRRLSEETGSAIVVIHHQRKSAANGDSNGARRGESLRGHSSIEAALDLALLVDRKEGEDTVSIIPTKVRDFIPVSHIGARFTYEHLDGTRDLWSARFYSEATMTPAEAFIARLRNVVLDVVRAHPGINQTRLVAEVRDRYGSFADVKTAPGQNKIRAAANDLTADGALTRSGESGSYQYYNGR